MKKIKLLTLGLLTLFGLGSFCSSELLSTVYRDIGGSTGTGQIVLDTNSVYCIYASYSTASRKVFVEFQNYSGILNTYAQNPGPLCFNVGNNDNILKYEFQGGSHVQLYYTKVMEYTSCDYSDYVPLSDYNTCLSDLNTATGNYQSCQSSISGYENSLNNCSTNLNQCSTSLSSCLSANCPNNTGNISWSALFINNIQHIGAPIIRMTIPEELSWDYVYTDSGNNMDIDIEGYNVDYDYINGVVNVQKYKPSSEDFTQVVGILAPYMKIFLFLLFLFIVIKRLKKPFKSRLK